MRAVVFHGREDVRVEDVAPPPEPGAGEILLDVSIASICGTDASEFAHGPLLVPLHAPHPGSGRGGPTVLGHEFTGRVAALGAGVASLAPGDRVVCGAGVSCGRCAWCLAGRSNLCARYYTIGLHADGGLADQVVVPVATCVPVPEGCSDRAAALAQPLAVAFHATGRARVSPGDSVAVIGVGGIGAFIIAAARARGAGVVLAVDVSEQRLTVASGLGADAAIDARGDAVAAIRAATGGSGADVVIEASGSATGLASATAAVRRGGRVLLVGLHDRPRTLDLLDLTVREIELTTTLAHVSASDLPDAVELLATSDLSERVIDRMIALEDVVEDGLVALAEGRANGKILVLVAA
ncbi:MAG TPA: alcohol dehydrogenase catalytic domain-containing protein [Gaiellales bacterium]